MYERNRVEASRRRFLAGLGSVAAAGLAGCTTAGQGDYDVGMTAVAFDPPTLTVAVGDEVVWRNTSSRGHTVTAYDDRIPEEAEFFATGGFENTEEARDAFNNRVEGLIQSGESFSHTFEVPGEYQYLCIPHEQSGMVGTIVVEEAGETTTDSA
ncbi:cupredoxin domain-containing protein [Halogeometricum limi]|uniref:Plastocyanin n=1 Tax=Halogeometricum limi TaxID=555875 RepID=A0A1I6GR09_9EURY|nr:plastocyanin/azurin family copper-binding protein [Halogeometricum limi]SFR44549.1 Plastocyanin [Halogeometricum limi]